MSTPTIPVVSKGGDVATGVSLKGGAIALMPASVGGRRGSKKMTKKMKKMLKALKMMKGGAVGDAIDTTLQEDSGLDQIETEEGGKRRRRSRKGGKSRRRSSKRSSSKGFFA